MAKTHTLPTTSKGKTSAFNLTDTVMTVFQNVNNILPGRGKDEKGHQKRRDAATPVLFNPNGRGVNAYKLVSGQARKFGVDKVSVKEIADIITDAGYSVSWLKDKAGKNIDAFRAVPVIGSSTNGSENVDEYLDQLFK
jgi:hypothetical protein